MRRLITVTGPSGSGKSTLVNAFFDENQQLISFTTRKPRKGEIDGKDYYFIDMHQLKLLKDDDRIIEMVGYHGNYYGYTKNEVLGKLKCHDCATVVTLEGYQTLKKLSKEYDFEIVPVFIHASRKDIEKRLKIRLSKGIDTRVNVNTRLALFDKESKNESFFKNEPNVIIHDNSGLSINQSVELFRKELGIM